MIEAYNPDGDDLPDDAEEEAEAEETAWHARKVARYEHQRARGQVDRPFDWIGERERALALLVLARLAEDPTLSAAELAGELNLREHEIRAARWACVGSGLLRRKGEKGAWTVREGQNV